MTEISDAAVAILTIVGSVVGSMMLIKSSLKESIDHIVKAVDRLEVDQRELSCLIDRNQREANARFEAEQREINARFEAERRETSKHFDKTNSRLDQLYSMFIDLLKEGRKS